MTEWTEEELELGSGAGTNSCSRGSSAAATHLMLILAKSRKIYFPDSSIITLRCQTSDELFTLKKTIALCMCLDDPFIVPDPMVKNRKEHVTMNLSGGLETKI